MRGGGVFLTFFTVAIVSGCQAVAPVAPSPHPSGIVILYAHTTLLRLQPRLSLSAYVIDSDGVYTNVSDKAQWSVSDPAVLRDFGSSGTGSTSHDIVTLASGTANVLASYQNVVGVLQVPVPPFSNTAGSVNLFSNFQSGIAGIGQTIQLAAEDSHFVDVSKLASWTSSDPSVATVSQGTVTSVNIGTTTITVAFGGGTDSAIVSVFPSKIAR